MSLLDRLTGAEEPKLPVHQFWASLAEWGDGHITRSDVISAYSIEAGEEAELDFIRSRWGLSADKPAFEHEIHRIFILAERSMHGYGEKAAMQARIDQIP